MTHDTAAGLYFDHAATSYPKPACVAAAMAKFLEQDAGNPGRGDHQLARRAADVVSNARRRLAALIGAPHPDRIVLTYGCTDALNIAIKGVLEIAGGHVVTTVLEHNSVLRPLRALERAGTISLSMVEPSADGVVDPDAIRQAVRADTRLVAVSHMSNVCGARQDLTAIGAIVRAAGALFLVDAAQSGGGEEIDVQASSIDLLALAGHKSLLGPSGTGALYVGPRCIPDHHGRDGESLSKLFRPWREGGGGNSYDDAQPNALPGYLEAGTPNVVGLAGLSAALDSLTAENRASRRLQLQQVGQALWQGLSDLSSVRLIAAQPGRSVYCLTLDEVDPHEVAALLDQRYGVAVRAGLHCAPEFHRWAGTGRAGALRISAGPENTLADVAKLVEALDEISRLY